LCALGERSRGLVLESRSHKFGEGDENPTLEKLEREAGWLNLPF
jgi:hypothetical protein